MRIVSVNVAMPIAATGTARGTVMTGIYKRSAPGPTTVTPTGLAGDGRGDIVNHGGPMKAVYAYATEDYDYWRNDDGMAIPEFGWFGENLSVQGASSDHVRVGDIWQIGAAQLQVTEPRSPCYMLDHKVGIPRFATRFQRSGRVGFYLRVLAGGTLAAEADVTVAMSHPSAITIRELSDYRHFGTGGHAMAERILALTDVGPEWQRRARKALRS